MVAVHTKTENVAAALKVFAVLEALVEAKQASLGDIAQRAMTSKATAHRLLQTMIDLGYVAQDPDNERYFVTLNLFSLAARSLNGQSDLLRVADPAMGKLSRATGEAVNLGVLDRRDQYVTYIHKYDSIYNLSLTSTLGLRNPLHTTSLGKALLAWRDDDEIRECLARLDMNKTAPNTITDRNQFFEQLMRVRQIGYAEEIEESEAGVRCLAAPILDHIGKSIAAISVSFPLFRFDEQKKPDYVSHLLEAGRTASKALGYDGPYPKDERPVIS